jgi:uncharacterized protein (TIGR03118 family)
MNSKTVLTVCGSAPLAFIAGVVGLLAPSVVPAFADPILRQTNLVSDVLPAVINDPNLTNAWGISEGPATPIWISDNGTGFTTLYSVPGLGSTQVSKVPLTVTIPSGSAATSAPTGQVFNNTASSFKLSNGSKAVFIFDSEDGVISAWNGGTNAEIEVNNSNSNPSLNAVYKGLAIDNAGGSLFATNFRSGMVEMYQSDAKSQFDLVASFTDPTLPAGYAPFGAAVLDGKLYVTFALQDSAKHDDMAGAGHGFVDTFDLSGGSMQRLISGGALNSPWGLAIAPSSFGSLAGDLLVGNFGDGMINAYKTDGTFVGALDGLDGNPLVIDGLWGLMFGNDAGGGFSNTLYFTAGPAGESEGLFGALSVVPEPSTWAMMLSGFAALAFAGYRRAQKIATPATA